MCLTQRRPNDSDICCSHSYKKGHFAREEVVGLPVASLRGGEQFKVLQVRQAFRDICEPQTDLLAWHGGDSITRHSYGNGSRSEAMLFGR